MRRHRSPVRSAAVFEQIDALPNPQNRASVRDRDRQARRGDRGAEVGGHVVGAFVIMLIAARLGREPREPALEIAARGGGGIFLDQQRTRRVPHEQREQPGGNAGPGNPVANVARTVVQPLAGRPDVEFANVLSHDMGLPQCPARR